ncbi:MAG: isocitrate lyase/phosphoenolpyruvate mutase family protein [Litoreibacter sp.]
MTPQDTAAQTFHALHKVGDPLVLFNIWDPGSAKAVEKAGAQALATGSAPVAMAHGFGDGEKIPFDIALDNTKRIIDAVGVPVSADLEGGYSSDPSIVAVTIEHAVKTGIVGFNFEDQIIGGNGLYTPDIQSRRIAASRAAADKCCPGIFINARTDIFLKAKPDTHTDAMLEDALERAKAFEQAGADGFFAPGLVDEGLIGKLCEACALPVNIIALPHAPDADRIKALGAARISYGPVPYKKMSAWLTEQAKEALASIG